MSRFGDRQCKTWKLGTLATNIPKSTTIRTSAEGHQCLPIIHSISTPLFVVTLSLYLNAFGRRTVMILGMSTPHSIHEEPLSRMTCRGRWNVHVLLTLVRVVSFGLSIHHFPRSALLCNTSNVWESVLNTNELQPIWTDSN